MARMKNDELASAKWDECETGTRLENQSESRFRRQDDAFR